MVIICHLENIEVSLDALQRSIAVMALSVYEVVTDVRGMLLGDALVAVVNVPKVQIVARNRVYELGRGILRLP